MDFGEGKKKWCEAAENEDSYELNRVFNTGGKFFAKNDSTI